MITIPPPFPEEPSSPYYHLKTGGQAVPVHTARLSETYTHFIEIDSFYSFASLDADEPVEMELESDRALTEMSVRSRTDMIEAEIDGCGACFTLNRPGSYIVERNGNGRKDLLLIFVNLPETDIPDASAPGVYAFGPGRHEVGKLKLGDHETLYIAPGAVVTGKVSIRGNHVRICGRGLLENTQMDKHFTHMIQAKDGTDITLEGILVRKNTRGWTVVAKRCESVHISNLKIIGSFIGNDDGIDPVNCTNMVIEDCFIRSNDDCLAFKGLDKKRAPSENIRVERCTFWSDMCCSILLGDECQADAFRNITIRDCFVPFLSIERYPKKFLTLHTCEKTRMENILIEAIEVRGQGQSVNYIEICSEFNQWCTDPSPGHLDGLTLRDIRLTGTPGGYQLLIKGYDDTYTLKNIHFETCTVNGDLITEDYPGLTLGDYTENVTFA